MARLLAEGEINARGVNNGDMIASCHRAALAMYAAAVHLMPAPGRGGDGVL